MAKNKKADQQNQTNETKIFHDFDLEPTYEGTLVSFERGEMGVRMVFQDGIKIGVGAILKGLLRLAKENKQVFGVGAKIKVIFTGTTETLSGNKMKNFRLFINDIEVKEQEINLDDFFSALDK